VQPTEAGRAFVAATRPRLADLSVAVRAAEQMPTSRRRAAYRAISGELDRIEIDLLTHLGVPT
jgi:DNA-binding transcriptional LysR family regulator